MGSGRRNGWSATAVLVAAAGCLASPPAAVDSLGEPDAARPSDAVAALSVERAPEIEIPDGEEVADSAEVEPLCSVVDLTVDIYITHPYRGDLVVTLADPLGQTALLKSFLGNDGTDDLIGNYPGDFVPDESLEMFAGGEARGSWTLLVRDAGEQDVGTLWRWSLNLTCQ